MTHIFLSLDGYNIKRHYMLVVMSGHMVISSETSGLLTLQWRHNRRDSVSNHRRLHCWLNCWFRRRSKKDQSPASLAFVWGNHQWPVNSPHKRPVMRKMFPFHDVIMPCNNILDIIHLLDTDIPNGTFAWFVHLFKSYATNLDPPLISIM